MNYQIRKMKAEEYLLLNDFLYEAIFVPEGTQPPPKSIIGKPELQVYISGFGTHKGDICFAAETERKVVGAAWARIMEDYGHIEDGVPSLAVSVYREYRGCGIGMALMRAILAELSACGYEKTSLSVQKANYAVKMYQKLGFEIIDENDEEYIMVYYLKK